MTLLKLLWSEDIVWLKVKMAIGYPTSEGELALIAILTQGLIPIEGIGIALQLLGIRFVARSLVILTFHEKQSTETVAFATEQLNIVIKQGMVLAVVGKDVLYMEAINTTSINNQIVKTMFHLHLGVIRNILFHPCQDITQETLVKIVVANVAEESVIPCRIQLIVNVHFTERTK